MTERPLRLLLDFDAQAQRDKEQPPAFLHRRDRKFALVCKEQGFAPDAARWLNHMKRLAGPGASAQAGEHTLTLWRRINAGFAGTGVVFGIFTMLGLLFYDGGQRINITLFLAFVLFQLVLALFTSIQSLAGWQPWHWLLRRLNSSPTKGVAHRLHPALMARAAHLGGFCFALAGLFTLLVLVVVQDLAFGWSTTLDTGSGSYHRLLTAVAAPWAWLWPAAVPDPGLVEATRFFRAEPGSGGLNPEVWGQWWPFVTMLWATWVLLPRLLLFILASALIRHKARQQLNSHPAMHALLYRMETPALDTGIERNDARDLPDTDTRSNLRPLPDSDTLVCWAGACEPELPEPLRSGKHLILKAGGRASLTDDQRVLNQVAEQAAHTADKAVLVVTRCWQPPTGELQDFLEAGQTLWPAGIRVVLVPLAADINQVPPLHQIQPWLRFAERLGHDFVMVSLPELDLQTQDAASKELP
ncbi:hypothetical protein BKP64_14915 [Marinobacter salinus]|uniref:DUF2868 domain-containing protein n=1 Tax=Marinobacter salinus TaxID=1874317 RepID=A0A1D9GPA8_9GAMM|nr:DUF2868 domain-containing protein [Marinobacter salinus]AOY89355.1 hypothetical protein BKP64_14915 [Marinobacter salinus]